MATDNWNESESTSLMLMPVMDLAVAKQRLSQFQEFVHGYLVEGEDFGTIPGTDKPTLLKPGADKLCELYGLADDYEIVQRTEDWNAIPILFDYEIKCMLRSKRDGSLVATGMGSCNSYESKYRWRKAQRVCPQCGKDSIIKGKEEYGGGWLCYAKKGGCGAKFRDNDPSIMEQTVGQVPNEDIPTLKNTILKMGKKRAKIDATLSATRSSGLFTQDMEDISTEPQTAKPSTNGFISREQLGALVALARDFSVPGEAISAYMREHHGIAAARLIPAQPESVYEDVVRFVENYGKIKRPEAAREEAHTEPRPEPEPGEPANQAEAVAEKLPEPASAPEQPTGAELFPPAGAKKAETASEPVEYATNFKKLFAIGRAIWPEKSEERLHEVLKQKWNIDSAKKIPKTLFPEIEKYLQGGLTKVRS